MLRRLSGAAAQRSPGMAWGTATATATDAATDDDDDDLERHQ
jgi:hypothetical protein